jgi:hypothetical protein
MSSGMESGAEFPDIDRGNRDTLSLYGFILNVHETVAMTRRHNLAQVEAMKSQGRSNDLRYLMIETPDSEMSLSDLAVPVANERIVLRPHQGEGEVVSRLIVRVPIILDERASEEGSLRDTFIEIVNNDGSRQRYLLNFYGLWPYDNASQIVNYDGSSFSVANSTPLENDGEVLENLSRYVADSGIDPQTNFDPAL